MTRFMTLPQFSLLLAVVFTPIASAATITKIYTFSGTGEVFYAPIPNATVQINGTFTYVIPTLGLPFFSNFSYSSTTSFAALTDGDYDLTTEANNPTINGVGPDCTGLRVGARATFELMTSCLATQTSSARALWILSFVSTGSQFTLIQNFGFPYTSGFGLALAQNSISFGRQETEAVGYSPFTAVEVSTWTTTLVSETSDEPQVPEPSTFLLVPAAAIVLLRAKLR
jgi:hypothetical protein